MSHKALIAVALGAALAIGSVAPSFALSGPGAALRGGSQSTPEVSKLEVRGGARYDQLQNDRAWADFSDPRAWQDQSDLYHSRGMVAEETGRAEAYL